MSFPTAKRLLSYGIFLVLLSACEAPESVGGSASPVQSSASPKISLVSDLTTVNLGGSVSMSWSATEVDNCMAAGDWSGAREVTGTEVIGSLMSDSSFELTCSESGGSGSVTDVVNVTVVAPAAPTVSLSANPASVLINGSTTLTWSSANVDTCTASGSWSGGRSTSGSITRNTLTTDKTYTLTCSGAGGTASDSATVTVVAPTVPVVNISANPANVANGGSTTLSWSGSNIDSCTASGNWSGGKSTSGFATRNNLTSDKTYTLTCTGAGGTASDSANVTVAPPPPPVPTLSFSANPGTVSSNGSTTLGWSSSDASSCSASGGWSGPKGQSGSQLVSGIMASTQFTLVCSGAGGNVSKTVTVTYNPGNSVPIANAGVDQNIVTGSPVSLNGAGSSDADNDPLTFLWTLTSKPAGSGATLTNRTIAAPSFTADVDGQYQISLVVNDGSASSNTDFVSVFANNSSASIYYVSTSGSNANDGTPGNEWGTISYGISRLQPGDTLVVRDGVYSGNSNFIKGMPDGTSSGFTTVKAETPFGVRISSTGSLDFEEMLLEASGQYIHVDGFIFDHRNSFYPSYTGEVSGQYVKLTRSIFRRQGAQDEYGGWLSVFGSYLLVEDVAGVGAARYGFYTGGTNSSDRNIIFRRVVGRLDYQSTSQPKSTFMHYGHNSSANSHHIIFQNCISLDSNQPSYNGGGFGYKYGGISVIKTASNDIISGSIILNEKVEYQASLLEGKNNLLENSVIWDNRLGNYGSVPPAAYVINSGFLSPPHNSIARNITAGQNQNPSQDNTPLASQMYLPMPDDYPANASNKAVILNRIGVSGTFYGDPGWNSVTNEDLWPWRYEDEIKSVFAEANPTPSGYTPSGNVAARGFAANGNGLYGGEVTLTSYIWEYLGNPCPGDLCTRNPAP